MSPKQRVLAIVSGLPDDVSLDKIREQIVERTIENGDFPSNGADVKQSFSTEEFVSQSIFGIWADRTDMADSESWVRQERATWQQRLSRPD
jgi:hypothetical protein